MGEHADHAREAVRLGWSGNEGVGGMRGWVWVGWGIWAIALDAEREWKALLGSWVVGLLGCWVVGFLGCWVVGWLGCGMIFLKVFDRFGTSSGTSAGHWKN